MKKALVTLVLSIIPSISQGQAIWQPLEVSIKTKQYFFSGMDQSVYLDQTVPAQIKQNYELNLSLNQLAFGIGAVQSESGKLTYKLSSTYYYRGFKSNDGLLSGSMPFFSVSFAKNWLHEKYEKNVVIDDPEDSNYYISRAVTLEANRSVLFAEFGYQHNLFFDALKIEGSMGIASGLGARSKLVAPMPIFQLAFVFVFCKNGVSYYDGF